jgi:hypothetical protein
MIPPLFHGSDARTAIANRSQVFDQIQQMEAYEEQQQQLAEPEETSLTPDSPNEIIAAVVSCRSILEYYIFAVSLSC